MNALLATVSTKDTLRGPIGLLNASVVTAGIALLVLALYQLPLATPSGSRLTVAPLLGAAVLGMGPWAIAFGAQPGSRLLGLFTPQTLVSWGLVLLCLGIGVPVLVLGPKMEGGDFLVPSYSSRPPLSHGRSSAWASRSRPR